MLHTSDLVGAWRRVQLAEIVFRHGSDAVDAAVAVPLLHDGTPCVALTYDQTELARTLGSADEVALLVTALAGDGPAGAVRAVADIVHDPEGTEFVRAGLLDQELAKHPPSRRRIDSLLLQREHWWLMPRLIVRFRELADTRPLDAAGALVAVAADALEVATCDLADRGPGELRLRLHGPADRDLPGGPAVVLEHGADVPDLERPWRRRWYGRLAGSGLTVDRYDEDVPPDRPLSLFDRWRRERALERGCRDALRSAGIH